MPDEDDDGDEEATKGAQGSASTPGKRVVGRPFSLGNNANPGGRPRTDARVRAALERLTPSAVAELKRLLKDERTPRRVRASIAMYVVDRRLGKPTISVGGADGQPFTPGPLAEDPIEKLWAMIRASKASQPTAEAQTPTEGENAPPGPAGEPGGGRPS